MRLAANIHDNQPLGAFMKQAMPFAAAVLLWLASTSSHAALIRVEADGTLSSTGAGINGQTFSFGFTINPDAPDIQPGNTTAGEYRNVLSDVAFRIGATPATLIGPDSPGVVIGPGESFFSSQALLQVNRVVPSPPAPPGTTIYLNSESYIAYFESGFGFTRPWLASFDFFPARGTPFPVDPRGRDDLLPADAAAFAADLAPWLADGVGPLVNLREFVFTPGSQIAVGNINRTTLRIYEVPEPPTWMLLALALPLLFAARRSRR